MSTVPFRPVLMAAIALAALGGCDRQSDEGAQPQAADAAPGPYADSSTALVGEPDYTFAGQAMPEARLVDTGGDEARLQDMQGTPVLLNLWATWCVPCVVEMPLLDDLAAESGEDLQVVTVSMDLQGADAVEPFFAVHGLPNLPRWMDAQSDLGRAFGGGPGLPISVLYDAEGREVWRILGDYEWDSAAARELIAEGL